MLVHTIALELNQRGVMQGEGRSKKGQRLVLLTASHKKSQHNKHDGQWTVVVPAQCLDQIVKTQPGEPLHLRGLSELEQTLRHSVSD